jgi:hypothetical protein
MACVKSSAPDFGESQIEERIQQLNDFRVTQMTSLKVIMRLSPELTQTVKTLFAVR